MVKGIDETVSEGDIGKIDVSKTQLGKQIRGTNYGMVLSAIQRGLDSNSVIDPLAKEVYSALIGDQVRKLNPAEQRAYYFS